ncbi:MULTISPECIES: PLP-dependent aminotransferase family protein [unclassified Ruegeria]|uniref:MocR-like pyridoxine biosynthesis transcription factor PdxR n=1 Tax=unclassified Ruegeria TaxID=2625375 RepID=UPI001AE75E41|nr:MULTISPECIES: PLP-dependent aminotransferase family protein [unclassified Ruegeria]
MANIQKKYQSNLDEVLFALSLDRHLTKPLHVQLADALRQEILSGRAASGARLPASRNLAEELSVSRMTITSAYDQLLGEGYLLTRKGAGTFVADHLPHLSPPTPRRPRLPDRPRQWLPFQPGLPDPALFPHHQWARCLERAWRTPDAGLLARPDPFGWHPLRAAISDHLSVWRGLDCVPEQVIITGGAWDAFDIICHVALESDQRVAIEDPGWLPLRHALERSGIGSIPVRIDKDGLETDRIPEDVSAAIVTPSRHYPTGTSMPFARRLALLDWARQNRTLIIEDDYDSEFRYQGQPLPSLSGLDGLQNTVYLGSFSKLLKPALRLGYMVVPEILIPPAQDYLSLSGSRASLTPQPALADFMDSGDFATHLRRMRRTYAKRQARLIADLADVAEFIEVTPDPSGMHLCCPLRPVLSSRTTDCRISALAREQGLYLRALSSHSTLPNPQQGLLLGYTAFAEPTLTEAAKQLTRMLTLLLKK